MEFKSVASAIKSIDDRTVVGICSVMGNCDNGEDIIHRGAYTKTIQEGSGRVRHLWQHDSRMPPVAMIKGLREVGRDELPDQTLRDYPDAEGGLEVTREYLDTPRGNEVLVGLRSGAISEMSIGFDPMKFDFEQQKNDSGLVMGVIRHIREVRLWDTSDVNWGMNPATTAVKSADDTLVSMYRDIRVELARRGVVTLEWE